MKKFISPLLMLVLAAFVMVPGWAQAGSGFYISSDIGFNVASGIDTTGRSNDRASVCDEYINPAYATVNQTAGYEATRIDPDTGEMKENYNCTGDNRGANGDWYNNFDSATGILAGAAVGYSFAAQNPNGPLSGLRVELEYFYRQSNYDQTAFIGSAAGESGDKLEQELVRAYDRIGGMNSHNIFANLYYDFANTSRFTPYIGVGGGIGVTNMEYGSLWARNDDANQITTGGQQYDDNDNPVGDPLPNAMQIQQNLAGTASFEDTILSDTLWGFQFLFGVDYAMTEAMSLGLKGRYVMFDSFDSGDGSLVWNPLRGHAPYLRTPDGGATDREHVSGAISTNNIQFFGISLNLKYHF